MEAVTSTQSGERGFTLLEVLIALAVLMIGLMSLAYGIGIGLAVVQMSTMDTIAREKAREAMETSSRRAILPPSRSPRFATSPREVIPTTACL